MSLLLAANIFQEEDQASMAFYCHIEGIKEGYMYINLGHVRSDYGFWRGLEKALLPLLKSYSRCHVTLAFPRSYMSIDGGPEKARVIQWIKRFRSVSFMEYPDYTKYEETLEHINILGKIDNPPLNVLIGYSIDDFKKRELDIISEKNKKRPKYYYYEGLSMPKRGVVIDFESTSNIVEYARIIEIGAVLFEDDQIIDKYHTLVNPGIKIPKKVRDLTGITDDDVKAAPKGYEAVRDLLHFIRKEEILVAHNAFFDYELLNTFCKRFKIRPWKGQLLCTQRLAKGVQIQVENYKLETLCKFFGIEFVQSHRADADALATFQLLKKLYENSMFR